MVQKDSNIQLEVVLKLLPNKESHIRALSRKLSIPHTTVLRAVNKLIKDNILDFKEEGKNKVVMIKRNLAAKNVVFMAENYKMYKFIAKYPQMAVVLKGVSSASNSDLVILFGSYAKFAAKADSDIDIYIESKSRNLKDKLKLIDFRINSKIGSFDLDNKLIKEVIKEHIIIKGVERFYEKTGFFK